MTDSLRFDGLSLDRDPKKRKLIVGIDFGTTYTGVAWAETRKPEQQTVINVWPSAVGTHEGKTTEKVPTELRYTPEGLEWGSQIPSLDSVERHKWFKLALAKKSSAQQHSPESLTRDYLAAIREHLMYTLEQKLGSSFLNSIPIEYCLTVPAMWPEGAKEKTLKAAKMAGLKNADGSVLLVSEPEAAAIYTLQNLDPHDLKIDDSFVLCDAGGGTVDLISYRITQLHPVIKVVEIAPGTGGLCGSTFLNQRFASFLEAKLGREKNWDEELAAEAMERFDLVIKRQYSKSNQVGYTILVPGLADNERLGIRRGRLLVTSAEMHGIFDEVVSQVIRLVRGQIKTAGRQIRAVLLVGGFGESNYLKEQMRADLGPNIKVMQPPNAWTAIARGATMMGLSHADAALSNVDVISRSARKHYGIKLHVDFSETEQHSHDLKYWDKKHSRFRVPAMRWFIKKGQAIEEGKPTKIHFGHHFLVSDGNPQSATTDILCDEFSDVAPVHANGNVRDLVSVTANFRGLSRAELESTRVKRKDDLWYYYIEGYVEATYSSAMTQYVLVLMGKRYDSVTAEYA